MYLKVAVKIFVNLRTLLSTVMMPVNDPDYRLDWTGSGISSPVIDSQSRSVEALVLA